MNELVYEYYKNQKLYLYASIKAPSRTQHYHDLFESARNQLADRGCTFKKKEKPERTQDHMSDLLNEFNYHTQIQEAVLNNEEMLLPPDSLDAELRIIINNMVE